MTINQAIAKLKTYNSATFETSFISFSKALQLGIEALIKVRRLQAMDAEYKGFRLPSETEE